MFRLTTGKSSLVSALFRLTEKCGGRIDIDGIDVSQVGLEQLRSRLSIIMQDPVLFSGTVRYVNSADTASAYLFCQQSTVLLLTRNWKDVRCLAQQSIFSER